MAFLNYFLISLVVYIGLLVGIVLAFMTKEELKPGKKYFILAHNIVLAFILFIIVELCPLDLFAIFLVEMFLEIVWHVISLQKAPVYSMIIGLPDLVSSLYPRGENKENSHGIDYRLSGLLNTPFRRYISAYLSTSRTYCLVEGKVIA